MVVGAFPIAKLAYLAFKQISKPIATQIKNRAKNSLFFREYICMPPAQFYHWVEVNVKMRMLNLGKPTEVPKLNEAMAIELGAELLGEGIIFVVAAACLLAEYRRSSNKERDKEEERIQKLKEMNQRIFELELKLEEQTTRIKELNRMTYGMHTSFSNWWKKTEQDDASNTSRSSSSPNQNETHLEGGAVTKSGRKGPILQAVEELEISMKSGREMR